MNKQFYPLLVAQFLSAFADNAILFTVIAMVMHAPQQASWYVPALQSVFLIAFVALAPWVGDFADKHPKARVLFIANIIKAIGSALLFVKLEPLLAYAVVGMGAAMYSPAKYGILPELAGHEQLVKANSWIEGSTIAAILLGMIVGAKVADYSINVALSGTIVLFALSALTTLTLSTQISPQVSSEQSKIIAFIKQTGTFFTTPRSRFAILGGSLFWATAATLRVILVAWAPLILAAKTATEIANLTLFLAIGIIVGSGIVPRLIPLEHLSRTRFAAYAMATCIVILSFASNVLTTQALLFCIGTLGGIFIVPINAVLQEHGKQSIGSGRAVALQGFFQNLAMLLAVGGYTFASAHQIDPVTAMLSLGFIVFIATFLVSWHLKDMSSSK
ncbi:MAG: lysophospholipid transporter LplT [Methylococcaceae bacterium]